MPLIKLVVADAEILVLIRMNWKGLGFLIFGLAAISLESILVFVEQLLCGSASGCGKLREFVRAASSSGFFAALFLIGFVFTIVGAVMMMVAAKR